VTDLPSTLTSTTTHIASDLALTSAQGHYRDEPSPEIHVQVVLLRDPRPCPLCKGTFRSDVPMLATPASAPEHYDVSVTHRNGLHTLTLHSADLRFRADCVGEPTAPPARGAVVSESRRPLLLSSADLLSDPSRLTASRPLFGPWLYAGHLTVMVARPKGLKSTKAGWIARCVSLHLGDDDQFGRVLWVSREEPERMVLARLASMGADLRNVKYNFSGRTTNPLMELRQMAGDFRPRLIVIDALAAYLPPDVDENSAPVGAFLRDLVSIARDTGAAILLLHHARKSDGAARGFSGIEAAADQVIFVRAENDGSLTRVVEGSGRFGSPRVVTEFDPDLMVWTRQESDDAASPDDEQDGPRLERPDYGGRVRRFLELNPGTQRNVVVEGSGGRAKEIRKALDALIDRGEVQLRDGGYFLA
jgi:hypothetical protein